MDGLGAIGKSNNRGSKSRHLSCGSPFMSGDVISGQDPPPGGTRGKPRFAEFAPSSPATESIAGVALAIVGAFWFSA